MKKPNYNRQAVHVLADMGYVSEIVEHYNYYAQKKKDFCGFADLIALNPDTDNHKILAVQITSRNAISTRYRKCTVPYNLDTETGKPIPNHVPDKVRTWLLSGGGLWIMGFRQVLPKRWDVKIREIILDLENNLFLFEDKELKEQ